MKAKRSNRLESDLNETGILLFLTLVIFFGAVGFPTLINTSPTFGYDDNTIAKLTPVTTYYQQAYAEQQIMEILGNYYFEPNIISAFMIIPSSVELPPPDMINYFQLKYEQGTNLQTGFIEYQQSNEVNSSEMFLPKNQKSSEILLIDEPVLPPKDPNFELENPFNFLDNIIQYAEGAEFYVKQSEIDSVNQGGTGSSCPSPTSVTFSPSGVWSFKASTTNALGCSWGLYSWDNNLIPVEFENYLANHVNPFWWGNDWADPQWNSGDGAGNVGCNIYSVSGAQSFTPNTDGRINATSAYESVFNLNAILTSTSGAGLCDADNAERYNLKDANPTNMNPDYLNRSNKTFYQVGTITDGIGNRDTLSRTFSATNTFLKYQFLLPANHSSNYWQMQEHPMFTGTFPAISTGFFGEVGSTFQMRSGDVNSEIGEVIIFKAFNKTTLGSLGDVRVVGEFEALGTTSDMNVHIAIVEGNIQAGQAQNINAPQFPEASLGHFPRNERMLEIGLFRDQFPMKSQFNVNNTLSVVDFTADSVGAVKPFDVSFTPFWAGSQNEIVTVIVGVQDNSASGRMILNLTSVEVEDEVKYDFQDVTDVWFNEPNCSTAMATTTTSTTDLETQHVKNCGVDYSNGLSEFNIVSLSGVTGNPNPIPADVTSLNVEFIGDVANLTWNHPQTNVSSFKIERDTGKGFKTLFYVPSRQLTTIDRTSLDLSGADVNQLGLPRSTSITYRVTPMNGDISGTFDSVTKTSNTINQEWEWKEYNFVPARVTNHTITTEGGTEKRLMMNFVTNAGLLSPQGQGWLFKVFPRSFINDTQIEVDWEGTKTGTFSGGTLEGLIKIFDGELNRFNVTQFNVTVGGLAGLAEQPPLLLDFDSVDFEGAPFDGALGRETHVIPPCGAVCDPTDPQWDDATSDFITLAVIYNDGGGKEGNLKIASIKVGDAFYNFSNPIIITEEINLRGDETQSGTFDFELLDPQTQQDTGLVIPSNANVTTSTPINFIVFQDGANEAELDWSDSLDADNYQVFRNNTLIGSPINSFFTDTTLSLGQVYVYKVRANNTEGFSDNSTQIAFGLIDPINNLVSVALNSTAIKIDWDLATTSHPTDPLVGVQITRNGTFLTTVDDLDITYTDGSLLPETNYVYVLRGVSTNSTGAGNSTNATTPNAGVNQTQTEEDFVAVAEEVVLTSPPFPITTLVGSTVGDTCNISWSAPSNGGSPITSYNIYRSVNGGFYVFLVSKVTTSHIDTGLANNVLYEYNVTALNAFGDAEQSNIVDCMPITTGVPSAPTGLVADEEPNGDVTLDWNEPATGDPTGYRIERKIAPASFSTLVNDTGTPSLTYLDVTTNPSTEYTYRVAGWNSFGLGAYSNEAVITTVSAPNAPILTAQQVGDVITVNWTQPASVNPINGYKIDRRVNFGAFSVFVANTTNTNLSFTDSDVTKPNTYGYRVRALSSAGEGTVSNVVDVVFGSHVIVQVREQDGSGFKGGGLVRAQNSTFSQEVGLNANSNAIFDNFAVGNYNYTFIDNSNFVLNKTFNFPFPSGNLTSTFTISALVFDVDCPANGVGSDVRIKVNYTDAKDIVSFPSTPVCDSTDQVSWSTRWVGENMTDTSIMVADFISTIFKANAKTFLASSEVIPTTYSSTSNAITSDPFQVNATDVTINFNLFLGRAPAGGGGSGSGSGSSTTSPSVITDPKVVVAQRLTGLSLLSRTHQFAQAGDILEGSVTVNWEGEKNLEVKSITPLNDEIDIRFERLPPFELNQRIDGIGEFAMSSAEIPYTIFLQPQECSEELGISQNCFNPILHTIPLEFEFEREGQVYEALTEVFVDGRPIPLDIVQLQIILLFLVLVASAVFGGFIRNRFKKKEQRTRKVKQKFKKKFDSS